VGGDDRPLPHPWYSSYFIDFRRLALIEAHLV